VDQEKRQVEEVAAQLAASPLRISARAGEDGRLFGSVTAADVVDALRKGGTEVDRRQVRLEEPIRSVGAHEVQIHLHPEVNATVTVEVVGQ
jgi:large subunit ribosomal protein L9